MEWQDDRRRSEDEGGRRFWCDVLFKAIIGNVQRGLQYAAKNPVKTSVWSEFDFSAKAIAGLIVVLMAAIVPLSSRTDDIG